MHYENRRDLAPHAYRHAPLNVMSNSINGYFSFGIIRRLPVVIGSVQILRNLCSGEWEFTVTSTLFASLGVFPAHQGFAPCEQASLPALGTTDMDDDAETFLCVVQPLAISCHARAFLQLQ